MTDVSGTIRAPWTDEQVDALNFFQASGAFHGYTCYVHSSELLLATTAGWRCIRPGCDYQQDWADASMADRPAVQSQVDWLRNMGFRTR